MQLSLLQWRRTRDRGVPTPHLSWKRWIRLVVAMPKIKADFPGSPPQHISHVCKFGLIPGLCQLEHEWLVQIHIILNIMLEPIWISAAAVSKYYLLSQKPPLSFIFLHKWTLLCTAFTTIRPHSQHSIIKALISTRPNLC